MCLSFPFTSFCPLQNGVHLPEDAVLGFGSGPFSSFTLCQAVPGTLPYAHWQYTSTGTQVRTREKHIFASRLHPWNNQCCGLRSEGYGWYLLIFQLVLLIHTPLWCVFSFVKQHYCMSWGKQSKAHLKGNQFGNGIWDEVTGSEIQYRQSMKNVQLKR